MNRTIPKRKLHLVTQDNQPYGSTRKSCELCGEWVLGNSSFNDMYAQNKDVFEQAIARGEFTRCDSKDGE